MTFQIDCTVHSTQAYTRKRVCVSARACGATKFSGILLVTTIFACISIWRCICISTSLRVNYVKMCKSTKSVHITFGSMFVCGTCFMAISVLCRMIKFRPYTFILAGCVVVFKCLVPCASIPLYLSSFLSVCLFVVIYSNLNSFCSTVLQKTKIIYTHSLTIEL